MKLWQGNVFTRVCHSVHRGGDPPTETPRTETPPQTDPPPLDTDPPGHRPPWTETSLDRDHPTGVRWISCVFFSHLATSTQIKTCHVETCGPPPRTETPRPLLVMPLDRDHQTETNRQRHPWTENPLDRDPPLIQE